MKRSKPLRRSPMKRRARRPKPGSDVGYMMAVKALPCAARLLFQAGECSGSIHAHHAGKRPGVGMKAPDNTTIPLCEVHHRHWHAAWGVFNRGREWRREWAEKAIAATRAEVDPLLREAQREVDAMTPGSPPIAGES